MVRHPVKQVAWHRSTAFAQWYPEYDRVADNGYQSFSSWVG